MKTFLLIVSLLTLTACSSEVDKCVDSQVAAWQAIKERDAEMWKQFREHRKREQINGENVPQWEVVDKVDVRKKEEIEAEARVMCLRLVKIR
jgi:hypothetical protein